MASVTFKRGTRAEIEATAKQDGQILMETDQTNNKMYVDLPDNNRVRIGNSNVDDISGITDSLTATSSNIALSAAGGNNLQGQIDTLNSNLLTINTTLSKKNSVQFAYVGSSNDVKVSNSVFDKGNGIYLVFFITSDYTLARNRFVLIYKHENTNTISLIYESKDGITSINSDETITINAGSYYSRY